jgi:hypothetical protein
MTTPHTFRASRLFNTLILFCALQPPAPAQTAAPPAQGAKGPNRPCMQRAEYRQFDFWVGEWDAYGPRGRKGGTSVVERFADGCGILENWTGALGGSGKSINFYDPRAGRWFQYWIGADGNPQRFSGTYEDGALRYEGEPFTRGGRRFVTRLTFFDVDANTVRQLSEQSGDGGKTWSTVYDLKYVRRGHAGAAPPNH